MTNRPAHVENRWSLCLAICLGVCRMIFAEETPSSEPPKTITGTLIPSAEEISHPTGPALDREAILSPPDTGGPPLEVRTITGRVRLTKNGEYWSTLSVESADESFKMECSNRNLLKSFVDGQVYTVVVRFGPVFELT